MYAFADETGNTGQNIFDEAQPYFLTAALATRANFDILARQTIASLAADVGLPALHANELGVGRLESVAEAMLSVLKRADARFVLARVEKKYLATTKIVDHVFDTGENLAVPWQAYNLRPLRLLLVFKVASLIDLPLAKQFWSALMEPNRIKASAFFVEACHALLARVGNLPDERSREIVSDALNWAIENPEEFQIHSTTKEARYGHLPNMVAFKCLIDGIDVQSRRWNHPVKVIVHDEQMQFERNFKLWHELYSNASAEPLYWPGEAPHIMRVVEGSKLTMSNDRKSVGIQVVDVILWLFKRLLDENSIGPESMKLLNFALKRAQYNDFSFEGVSSHLKERMDIVMSAEISEEQMRKGAELMAKEKQRRETALLEFAERRSLRDQSSTQSQGLNPVQGATEQ